MGRSWIGGAAAALVLALGPAATSEASAATFTGGEGATSSDRAGTGALRTTSGNLTAGVPGAAIAGDDHLPPSLEPGHTYDASFVIWVAPNARRTTVKVHAVGGVGRYCSAAALEPGIDRHLTCQIRTRSTQRDLPVTVTIVVRTGDLGEYSRSYRHSITLAMPPSR